MIEHDAETNLYTLVLIKSTWGLLTKEEIKIGEEILEMYPELSDIISEEELRSNDDNLSTTEHF